MRLRTSIISALFVGMGILIVLGLRGQFDRNPVVRALPVPEGDREIAWIHTSTNGAAWERFVAGVHRIRLTMPNVAIDDSRAFLERSTAIPEVVVSWNDRPGKLRIRWYKVSSETSARQWIDALAEREPAPLAIIGGGSSDRARDLALDLQNRTEWKGQRPLLLITTATANEVNIEGQTNDTKLTKVYPDRSFRFCFTNEQMALAVVDFVWSKSDLRPAGGPANQQGETLPPMIFRVYWKDDPYSIDLSEKFLEAVDRKTNHNYRQPHFIKDPPYSVGTFDRANRYEAEFAREVVAETPMLPGQRSLLILPTGTTPARRFLRALAGESPLIGKQLVAATGDAININDIYRDGALLWNARDVPVPLVFFAHQNPIGWDDDLSGPAGTDEVRFFAEMFEVLAKSTYPPDASLVTGADELRDRIRGQHLVPFDEDGNRLDGREFVIHYKPDISGTGHINARASLEVWRRSRKTEVWKKIGETLLTPYLSPAANRNVTHGL